MTTVASGQDCETSALMEDGGEAGGHMQGSSRCSVYQASFLIVAAVVGLGIMALPSSIAKLGWVPGLGALVLLFAVNMYTGLILWRLRVAIPGGVSYTHLGAELMGNAGQACCRAVSLTQLFMLEAEYLLVNTQSLATLFPSVQLCQPTWGLVMGALLLPLVQIRTLHHVSFLSAASGAAVLLVLLICMREMLWGQGGSTEESRSQVTTTHWATGAGVVDSFHALASIVFACGSHFVYLEVMGEMKNVLQFPAAMNLAGVFVLGSYVAISAAGYGAYGEGVRAYAVDVLPPGPARQAASLLMLLHTMVSYILMSQILCTSLLQLSSLRIYKSPKSPASASREDWLLVSALVLMASFLVANVVPFFEDLTVIIGSLIGAPICFGIPATFLLRAHSQGKMSITRCEQLFLCGLLVFTLLLIVLGLNSGLVSLARKWDTFGLPFECHCLGDSCIKESTPS
mmetsp:Transcript_42589/g.79832  ORF Transcript_42589/g.79832 Transcript_42589/m.79832 type:complete len:457 (+) Transcript_42589:297-1667(+)